MLLLKRLGKHPRVAAAVSAALLLALILVLPGWLASRADQLERPYDEKLAKRLILTRNCGSCHSLQARGLSLRGKVGPDLTYQGRRGRSAEWLRRHLTHPQSIPDEEVLPGYEGKQKLMPPLRASEAEVGALIAFLQDLR